MFVKIRRHFELGYTNYEKKRTEAYSERCGAIDTNNDSGKGNEQCEAGSDVITLILLSCFHLFVCLLGRYV